MDKLMEVNETMETRICVVGNCSDNASLMDAVNSMGYTTVFSENGLDFIEETTNYDTVFICDAFDSVVFDELKKLDVRILGPPIVRQCALSKEPLPCCSRPLYSNIMAKVIVCFTGFKSKEDLTRLVSLVHHMGGSVRKDIGMKVTHLVAQSTRSEKYKRGVTMGAMVMTEEWVTEAWQNRNETDASVASLELMRYKLKPFHSCLLSFHGFSAEETNHMREMTKKEGGQDVDTLDADATHLVVDENQVKELPQNIPETTVVVKQEWFWVSIQMEASADENLYMYKGGDQMNLRPRRVSAGNTPNRRKRRRLPETLAHLAQDSDPDSPLAHRGLSSVTEAVRTSACSLLDKTTTPGGSAVLNASECSLDEPGLPVSAIKPVTARHQVAMELYQTETNYCGILHTILTVFKQPLDIVEQRGGPILAPEEIRSIFGNLLEIYEVHRKIKSDLHELMCRWAEDRSIGDIIMKYADELLKCYPRYVNFFEMSKETLTNCDKQNPRFHAFLKIGQSKPECGRQTLAELMIRPVQRLPSVILLLTDLIKRTDASNEDNDKLEQALCAVKEVTKHINEDKRKTESQVQMFEIHQNVDGMPAYVLSSHRTFVMKVDCVELGESVIGRGENISLFLFNDSLEISKRKTRSNSIRSTGAGRTPQKGFKHVELLQLSAIKRVVDINESDNCHSVFALVVKTSAEDKEKLYSFALVSTEVTKSDWLKTLCHQMATACWKTDAENFLTSMEANDLDIQTSNITNTSIIRAVRAAKKTTKKVGRALSFNKTPRPVKRAMSTISATMSPLMLRSRMSSATMGARLASCSDLSALSQSANKKSAQPGASAPKRLKSGSFSRFSTSHL